ncbi:MAG: MliC family protein [Candidatus Paceibacterota bacterium]
MNKKILIFGVIIILVFVGSLVYFNDFNKKQNQPPVAQVTYICNDNKTINATYYKGETKTVKPGEQPIQTGSVNIVLSDGRALNLLQTISADGSRYANSDETFVFWGKGNGALVLENNIEKNYIGCVIEAKDPGELPNIYHDGTVGFSIRYPSGYSVNPDYQYQALGPNKEIHGTKFTVSPNITNGTNLSNDTGISIEIIPNAQNCNAGLFLLDNSNVKTITDNNTEYSFASSSDAAAGNRYEESVWAFSNTNSCIAIRYFIHYGAIENYPQDTIQEFNKTLLINQFDKIRQTLIVQ